MGGEGEYEGAKEEEGDEEGDRILLYIIGL